MKEFFWVALLSAGCAYQSAPLSNQSPSTASSPQVAVSAPAAEPASSVPIVEFSGDGAAIGQAHGQRFGSVIQMLYATYLMRLIPPSQLPVAYGAAQAFVAEMQPQHQAEVAALAESSGVSQPNIALGQCFLDLLPVTGCSTIALPADASPDGVARFGRNLDFPSMDIADKYTAVMIYHPTGRYAFAAIGWPGMIGALSGMNEKGLCLSNMEVDRDPRPPTAMPYTLLYRCVLEQCADVNQAIELLKNTPRQSANNLMLVDAAGNRAVAEITPDNVTVRWGMPGTSLISTNHQRGEDYDSPGRCWRFDLLHKTSAADFAHINRLTLESMLGSVVQGNDGDMTLQSMIFEPAHRVLYLATGSDAPSHPYERIDLTPYFNHIAP